ncbi:MAG: hypothetical protein QME75_05630 [Deltaproteobacteria bacterium]|nr:hypothetical protein [Deltaproteobacteria bacterium]
MTSEKIARTGETRKPGDVLISEVSFMVRLLLGDAIVRNAYFHIGINAHSGDLPEGEPEEKSNGAIQKFVIRRQDVIV